MKFRALPWLLIMLTISCAGCQLKKHTCRYFSVGGFKNYISFTDIDFGGEQSLNQNSIIQLVEPEWGKNPSETTLPVYLRIEYLGNTLGETGDNSWDESAMLSFSTSTIQWKGFVSYQNYGTLTLIGVDQSTGEVWKVTGNQLDNSGKEVYSVEDVQRWLKTIKVK